MNSAGGAREESPTASSASEVGDFTDPTATELTECVSDRLSELDSDGERWSPSFVVEDSRNKPSDGSDEVPAGQGRAAVVRAVEDWSSKSARTSWLREVRTRTRLKRAEDLSTLVDTARVLEEQLAEVKRLSDEDIEAYVTHTIECKDVVLHDIQRLEEIGDPYLASSLESPRPGSGLYPGDRFTPTASFLFRPPPSPGSRWAEGRFFEGDAERGERIDREMELRQYEDDLRRAMAVSKSSAPSSISGSDSVDSGVLGPRPPSADGPKNAHDAGVSFSVWRDRGGVVSTPRRSLHCDQCSAVLNGQREWKGERCESCGRTLAEALDALDDGFEFSNAGASFVSISACLEYLALLDRCQELALRFYHADLTDLRRGHCTGILRELQEAQVKMKPEFGCRDCVTKLMMNISRVARVVEPLKFTQKELESLDPEIHPRVPRSRHRRVSSGDLSSTMGSPDSSGSGSDTGEVSLSSLDDSSSRTSSSSASSSPLFPSAGNVHTTLSPSPLGRVARVRVHSAGSDDVVEGIVDLPPPVGDTREIESDHSDDTGSVREQHAMLPLGKASFKSMPDLRAEKPVQREVAAPDEEPDKGLFGLIRKIKKWKPGHKVAFDEKEVIIPARRERSGSMPHRSKSHEFIPLSEEPSPKSSDDKPEVPARELSQPAVPVAERRSTPTPVANAADSSAQLPSPRLLRRGKKGSEAVRHLHSVSMPAIPSEELARTAAARAAPKISLDEGAAWKFGDHSGKEKGERETRRPGKGERRERRRTHGDADDSMKSAAFAASNVVPSVRAVNSVLDPLPMGVKTPSADGVSAEPMVPVAPSRQHQLPLVPTVSRNPKPGVIQSVSSSTSSMLLRDATSKNLAAAAAAMASAASSRVQDSKDADSPDDLRVGQTRERAISTDEAPIDLLCRICEEVVPLHLMEQHSRVCAIANKYEVKTSSCDDKLAKLIKGLDAKIRDRSKKKKQSEAVARLQELRVLAWRACALSYDDQGYIRKSTEIMKLCSALVHAARHDTVSLTFSKRIEGVIVEKFIAGRQRNTLRSKDKTVRRVGSSVFTPRSMQRRQSQRRGSTMPTFDDFEFIKPISRGAFGAVFLARKKKTGDFFAIKTLKIADMLRKNQLQHIRMEQRIMARAKNPFVVKLFYSFQARNYLYLVMEYVPGGDLFSLLQNLNSLPLETVRLYAAEIAQALEYLHSEGIVHRDLKPDNILVTHEGHLKLTDFGLSRAGLIDQTQRKLVSSQEQQHFAFPMHRTPIPRGSAFFGSAGVEAGGIHGPAGSVPRNRAVSGALQPMSLAVELPMFKEPLPVRRSAAVSAPPLPAEIGGERIAERRESSLDLSGVAVGADYDTAAEQPRTPPEQMIPDRARGAPGGELPLGRGGGDTEAGSSMAAAAPPGGHGRQSVLLMVENSQWDGAAGHGSAAAGKSGATPAVQMVTPDSSRPFFPRDTPGQTPVTAVRHGGSWRRARAKERARGSFVGTPDYLAPEIVLGTGHDKTADWWSLGVIVFELLTGVPPFNADSPESIFENIVARNIEWPEIPRVMPWDCYDLINRLLALMPEDRLGRNGATEVKEHPFFNGVDFDNLLETPVPFLPALSGRDDTSYFVPPPTNIPVDLPEDADRRNSVPERLNRVTEALLRGERVGETAPITLESLRHREVPLDEGEWAGVSSDGSDRDDSVPLLISGFDYANADGLDARNREIVAAVRQSPSMDSLLMSPVLNPSVTPLPPQDRGEQDMIGSI